MPDATAKFPSALLALADVGGELVGLTDNEWTVNGAITAGQAAPFSLVVNETIDALVPAAGWLTTANNEILHYNAVNPGTKTFTIDARAQQDAAAASAIDNGSVVGLWLTKRVINQIVAEIIAMQTQSLGGIHNPNLAHNADFGRRNSFVTAMMDIFPDTSGYQLLVDGGTDPTVASNILTFNASSHIIAWPKTSITDFWRDGRASATFKAVSTTGLYQLIFRLDSSANNYIRAVMNNGSFVLSKVTSGTNTDMATVGQALTLNRWYWLEVEAQGTTVIARIYDTGSTSPTVPKASSTLLQTLTGTLVGGDATGGGVGISCDQSTGQWGGIAGSPGGVYVETWLPESYAVSFTGAASLGGQCLSYDEAVDAGPLGKQWAIRASIPATNRAIQLRSYVQHLRPSTAHAFSIYMKVSNKGGTGSLLQVNNEEINATTDASIQNTQLTDSGETSWTRKTGTVTTHANTRRMHHDLYFNGNATATGIGFYQLGQVELGSVATAWRNAPSDETPILWQFAIAREPSTTSGTLSEVDPAELSSNLFLPWECHLKAEAFYQHSNTEANSNRVGMNIDGVDYGYNPDQIPAAGNVNTAVWHRLARSFSGNRKVRVATMFATSAGTMSWRNVNNVSTVLVTAYRAK